MPSKFLFGLFMIASLGAAPSVLASDIAVVDFQKIMSESAETQRALSEIDTMKQAMQKQLQGLEKEIKSESEALERKRSVMSEEQIVEEETALKGKLRELRLKEQNLTEKLRSEVMLRRKQMNTVVLEQVSKLAQEKGFKIVAEKGNLLYADDSVDITSDLLSRVNSYYENN